MTVGSRECARGSSLRHRVQLWRTPGVISIKVAMARCYAHYATGITAGKLALPSAAATPPNIMASGAPLDPQGPSNPRLTLGAHSAHDDNRALSRDRGVRFVGTAGPSSSRSGGGPEVKRIATWDSSGILAQLHEFQRRKFLGAEHGVGGARPSPSPAPSST